jgi:hypothetical protein
LAERRPVKPFVVGSSPTPGAMTTGSLCGTLLFVFGAVAQWSEQGTHNPRVVGSIPTRPTQSTRDVRQTADPSGGHGMLESNK